MRKLIFTFTALIFSMGLFSQEKTNQEVIEKIRKHGTEKSRVMEIAHYLTDVSGPRLTASPGFLRAANWAKAEMKKWGLQNVQLEPWGEFGKGWEQERSYIAMTAPYYQPIIAVPRAWTGSTPGPLRGEIVLVKVKDTTEF